MNRTESILATPEVTLRNSVVMGCRNVWILWPMDRAGVVVPRLYYADAVSLFCDLQFAFQVGGLFSSCYQARLWCGYHGFQFLSGEILPKTPAVRERCDRPSMRGLRPLADFRVQAYDAHRQRCADCQRYAARAARFGTELGGITPGGMR